MLSGDNGLLKRAGDARDDTIVGQEKEQVELAYVSAAVKKLGTDVDESDMQTELNSSVGNNKTKVSTNTDDTLNVLFYDTEHNYNVNTGTVARVADGLPVIAWTYDHSTQTVTNGTLTMKIGDYVNDTGSQSVEGFDGKWRVLGAENGQLLFVSDMVNVPFSNSIISSYDGVSSTGGKYLKINGEDGYNNGVDALNAIGASFNNGKLENGRSIKVEDINNLTGLNHDSNILTLYRVDGYGESVGDLSGWRIS